MGILSHALSLQGNLITVLIDKYGDQVTSGQTSVQCRFRYITELDRTSNLEGITTADAIMWFEPDVDLNLGSIIKAEGEYWRVERLVKAKRMTGPVLFLKALVKKHQLADAS